MLSQFKCKIDEVPHPCYLDLNTDEAGRELSNEDAGIVFGQIGNSLQVCPAAHSLGKRH